MTGERFPAAMSEPVGSAPGCLENLAAVLDRSMIGALNAIVDRTAALACLPAEQQQAFETVVAALGARLQSERARRLELESCIARQSAELARARRGLQELTPRDAAACGGAGAARDNVILAASPTAPPAPTVRPE